MVLTDVENARLEALLVQDEKAETEQAEMDALIAKRDAPEVPVAPATPVAPVV